MLTCNHSDSLLFKKEVNLEIAFVLILKSELILLLNCSLYLLFEKFILKKVIKIVLDKNFIALKATSKLNGQSNNEQIIKFTATCIILDY